MLKVVEELICQRHLDSSCRRRRQAFYSHVLQANIRDKKFPSSRKCDNGYCVRLDSRCNFRGSPVRSCELCLMLDLDASILCLANFELVQNGPRTTSQPYRLRGSVCSHGRCARYHHSKSPTFRHQKSANESQTEVYISWDLFAWFFVSMISSQYTIWQTWSTSCIIAGVMRLYFACVALNPKRPASDDKGPYGDYYSCAFYCLTSQYSANVNA